MDLEAPETWRILWVSATGLFLVAEMLRRLRLWFLPFAVGSALAATLAFGGAAVGIQVALFAAMSLATLAALRPVARLLAASSPHTSAGSARWVGRQAKATTEIPPFGQGTGWVVLGRERWRAQGGFGVTIPAGSAVLVTAVDGTSLTVLPLELPKGE